jgi:hypothetical protein
VTKDPGRLGPLAILGAWLGLWTPPRDAVVPPVPWRRIAALAAVLGVALTVTAVIVVDRVNENRDAARQRAARAEAERHAAFLASVDRRQRPRHGRLRPGDRPALLNAARAAIERDARTRTAKRVLGVQCGPFPRTLDGVDPIDDPTRTTGTYDCVAVTARLAGGQGVIGMPFRLLVNFDSGRFAWCRIVPLGDQDRLQHALPGACRR